MFAIEILWYVGVFALGFWLGRRNIKQLLRRLACKLFGHVDSYAKRGMKKCSIVDCDHCGVCDRCNLYLTSKP